MSTFNADQVRLPARLPGWRGLGRIRGRRFYAARWDGSLPPPPGEGRFVSLVRFCREAGADERRRIGECLLTQGCREVCVTGEGAGCFADDFSVLCDERGVCDCHAALESDGEGLEDILSRHMLPDGLADTVLFLVVGEAGDCRRGLRSFGRAAGLLREYDSEAAPKDDMAFASLEAVLI